ELGDGPPVVLIHGFPELAYSWRHQLPALAAAGYRAIAPDMRGYGGTDKPPAVADYGIHKLIGDVTGLMDALGLDRAVIVGHDWGALVGWQMCLLAPERMEGYVALNIPFFKRPPVNPITLMRLKLGRDFYIVNFQDSDEADRRFGAEPRRFIDAMMRRRRKRESGTYSRAGSAVSDTIFRRKRPPISLLGLLDREDPGGEPFLTPAELDYYTRAFEAGGFTGPINWYRNFRDNWKSTRGVPQRVTVPTLFIGASEEIVVGRGQIEAMKPHVDDLEIRMIDDCGHWSQQEKPDEVSTLIIDWLTRRCYPKR
ncbi:MAG: alpha/beta hydrolase, partial [Gammaproteobacteria bacterium]|nr:alpha/beta hydrolase [Gammaproteobacteria bacterium]